jgi:BirA family transcriptional regulator, biotin operon repressor / biotin---[acetyl-CoA-carboxylase] ligase
MTQWPAEVIWEAVVPLLPDFSVEVLPEVDSTNTELMRRARAGQFDPVLLVAERQTAGRGRLGRDWHSGQTAMSAAGPPQGAMAPTGGSAAHAVASAGALPSLTFSVGLPLAPVDWSGLSLAVGLAVAEALHPDIGLKWPNDLWWQGRKLAGILIETASAGAGRYAVVGVGVNIAPRPADGLNTPPAWLQELDGGLSAPQALRQVAPPLLRTLKAFEAAGFMPFRDRFRARDVLANRAVTLSDGSAGTARGVDETGALLVHTAAGMQRVTSSEISVRPVGGEA